MVLTIPKTNWIWMPDWNESVDDRPSLVYFRKKMNLEELPEHWIINVSADTRYKLYVNGNLVEYGPSKGDDQVWFYDEVDIAPWLNRGENVLAAEVLRYPLMHRTGNFSMFRTATPGFYIREAVSQRQKWCADQKVRIETDESWKCRQVSDYHINAEDQHYAPLMILEERSAECWEKNWRLSGYKDQSWLNAVAYNEMKIAKASCPGDVQKRTIPSMTKIDRKFMGLVPKAQSGCDRSRWQNMLAGRGKVIIQPHTKLTVEIDAGELNCGYLSLSMEAGTGTVIRLLTSEGYVQKEPGRNPWVPKKTDRCDWKNGHLDGFTDTYYVGGFGEPDSPESYEPFWFRTFRFVQLDITTASEPLTLTGFDYKETGYPLKARAYVETSDTSLAPIWDISLRTLKRCMHETYVDCPFYEQLQYAMDSRSEILYTYMVSGDDRLARKCMDDFRRSQRSDGMINSCYPCYGPNVIPGFSIYYIMMVYDHMMYFGDQELIHDHAPAIDHILRYFQQHLEPHGLVGKTGGVNLQEKYWSFIDWTTQWNETVGMPTAGQKGPITMESLLYIMGLQAAAKLMAYIGRQSTAEEYQQRALQVQKAVNTYCRDKTGMYTDGPGIAEYSQHTQVFAVLTDTATLENARKNLQKTMDSPHDYAQCSVAMSFYLFRALEKTGLYEATNRLWNLWRDMIHNNLTTCVENNVDERSDCHAWGSLILYELPAVILGVRPGAPGFKKILISPEPGHLTWAKGTAITKWGPVSVEWQKEQNGSLKLTYHAPHGVPVEIDSKSYHL